jgi:hypothetical protein
MEKNREAATEKLTNLKFEPAEHYHSRRKTPIKSRL